jgi:hypothetical protein
VEGRVPRAVARMRRPARASRDPAALTFARYAHRTQRKPTAPRLIHIGRCLARGEPAARAGRQHGAARRVGAGPGPRR